MKKRDLYLIAALIFIAVTGIFFMKITEKGGTQVVITIDGKLYKEMSLNKDTEISIHTKQGDNEVKIENGLVWMKEADCPDQICVKHSRISKSGETIVCLPHKVVVEIKSDKEEEIDSVVQ